MGLLQGVRYVKGNIILCSLHIQIRNLHTRWQKKNIVMLTAFIRPIHFDLICKPDVNIIYTYGRASPLHAFYLRIGLVILPVARLQEITMLMSIRPS